MAQGSGAKGKNKFQKVNVEALCAAFGWTELSALP